jgi:hypothetical protein
MSRARSWKGDAGHCVLLLGVRSNGFAGGAVVVVGAISGCNVQGWCLVGGSGVKVPQRDAACAAAHGKDIADMVKGHACCRAAIAL